MQRSKMKWDWTRTMGGGKEIKVRLKEPEEGHFLIPVGGKKSLGLLDRAEKMLQTDTMIWKLC